MSYDEIYEVISDIMRGEATEKAVMYLEKAILSLDVNDVIFDKGESLYRAQLGGKLSKDLSLCAHDPIRMIPDPNKVGDGRFNKKGQAVLYFAKSKQTAINEIRPWSGAEMSVVEFLVIKQLKLASIEKPFRSKMKLFLNVLMNNPLSRK